MLQLQTETATPQTDKAVHAVDGCVCIICRGATRAAHEMHSACHPKAIPRFEFQSFMCCIHIGMG